MKKKFMKAASVCLLVAMTTTACTQGGGMGIDKQTMGGLAGAAGGAVAGAQFGSGRGQLAMVAAGTLLGAFVGSEIGKSLDRADMNYANQSAQYAWNSGQQSTWRNPDSGAYGTVTPMRSYENASGNFCREYQQVITVSGKTERAYGTACRQPDGTWRIVS